MVEIPRRKCPKCGTTSKKFKQNGEWMECKKCGYVHYPIGKQNENI